MWEAWWLALLAYAKETSVTSDQTCRTDDVTSIVEETADVVTVKDYLDVTVAAIRCDIKINREARHQTLAGQTFNLSLN